MLRRIPVEIRINLFSDICAKSLLVFTRGNIITETLKVIHTGVAGGLSRYTVLGSKR